MNKIIPAYLFFLFCFLGVTAQEHSLDYFINQGLANSPLLKDYQNQIRSNIQDSLLIRAGHKPKIDATGQILIPPYGKNFGYAEPITNGGNYSAVVGVSQRMFTKNILNNQYENIGLQGKAVANNAKISEHELKKLIGSQYLTTFAQYSEMLFSKEVLELLQKEEQIMKRVLWFAIAVGLLLAASAAAQTRARAAAVTMHRMSFGATGRTPTTSSHSRAIRLLTVVWASRSRAGSTVS